MPVALLVSPGFLILFARSALLVVCVGAIGAYCLSAALRRGEGAAGGAVRFVATLVAPATALAFAGIFFWPIALAMSVCAAVLQGRGALQLLADRFAAVLRALSPATIAASLVLAAVVSLRCAAALSSPPADGDGLAYHLPMTAAMLQDHSMWFTRTVLYPGAGELIDAIGGGALGAQSGRAIIECGVLLSLLLAAYGWARRAGARADGAVAAAVVAAAMPITVDQMLTSQNDLLVCAMAASACALWRPAPRLAAIALGLVMATKVTGLLLVPAIGLVMLAFEGWPFSLSDVAWAVALAAPWFVRTLLLAGTPLYSVASLGWSSTIAGNYARCWWWTLTAIRNYGSLAAILAPLGLAFAAFRRGRPALAGALPWLALASYVAWTLMPNGAESVAGTLDQIRSGWSIRYAAMLPFVLATSFAIVVDSTFKIRLAGLVAIVVAAGAVQRTVGATAALDPNAFLYLLPVGACALALALALVARRSATRAAWLSAGILAWSWAGAAGAQDIERSWNAKYLQWNVHIPPSNVIGDSRIHGDSSVAVVGMRSFPLVGPDFRRRVYEHVVASSPAAWLAQLRRDGVALLVATGDTGSPFEPTYLQRLPDEIEVSGAAGVSLLTTDGYVRVYSLQH